MAEQPNVSIPGDTTHQLLAQLTPAQTQAVSGQLLLSRYSCELVPAEGERYHVLAKAPTGVRADGRLWGRPFAQGLLVGHAARRPESGLLHAFGWDDVRLASQSRLTHIAHQLGVGASESLRAELVALARHMELFL